MLLWICLNLIQSLTVIGDSEAVALLSAFCLRMKCISFSFLVKNIFFFAYGLVFLVRNPANIQSVYLIYRCNIVHVIQSNLLHVINILS